MCLLAVKERIGTKSFVSSIYENYIEDLLDGNIVYRLEKLKEEISSISSSDLDLETKKKKIEEVYLTGIDRYPFLIQFIEDQTEKICLLAVKKDGLLLQYVKQQTLDICRTAIEYESSQKSYTILEYVDEKYKAKIKHLIDNRRFWHGVGC